MDSQGYHEKGGWRLQDQEAHLHYQSLSDQIKEQNKMKEF